MNRRFRLATVLSASLLFQFLAGCQLQAPSSTSPVGVSAQPSFELERHAVPSSGKRRVLSYPSFFPAYIVQNLEEYIAYGYEPELIEYSDGSWIINWRGKGSTDIYSQNNIYPDGTVCGTDPWRGAWCQGPSTSPSPAPTPTPTPTPAPVLTLAAADTFSPNGDFLQDTLFVKIQADPSLGPWELSVDGFGTIASGSDDQRTLEWNGAVAESGTDTAADARLALGDVTLRLRAGELEVSSRVSINGQILLTADEEQQVIDANMPSGLDVASSKVAFGGALAGVAQRLGGPIMTRIAPILAGLGIYTRSFLLNRTQDIVSPQGITAMAAHMQKHAVRAGSVFPVPTGNVASKNALAKQIAEQICLSPNVVTKVYTHTDQAKYISQGFGSKVIDVRLPNIHGVLGKGMGIRFGNKQGQMIGLLEPNNNIVK